MADEPNKIINYNDKYFINSNYIKVFPTANRGAGINLESKVSTEFNFRHLSPNFTKDSYIINADTWNATTSPANTLECCIAGYYFEIALKKSDFKYTEGETTTLLNYLVITLKEENITTTEKTWRLASRLSTANEDDSSAGASDTILDTEDIFTGLELLESLPSISETSATYYLDITNKNKVAIDYSRIQSEIKDVAITGNLTNGTGRCSIAQIYGMNDPAVTTLYINKSTGSNSVAFGDNTHAIGNYGAFAEGSQTHAEGDCSHAEGGGTYAKKACSHAEGETTIADGIASHAEGTSFKIGENTILTTSAGKGSHAEGCGTKSNEEGSHSEGIFTQALAKASHAEGYSTKATNSNSHAEGNSTEASGINAHAEGNQTIATGNYSHAEGSGSITPKTVSSISGSTLTMSSSSHEIVAGNVLRHTEDSIYQYYKVSAVSGITVTLASTPTVDISNWYLIQGIAFAETSHVEGEQTTSSGKCAHAEGAVTNATGDYSHAEGDNTIASGTASHAEGKFNEAIGDFSHAEGLNTEAYKNYSHSEGSYTKAFGIASHSGGYNTNAIGDYSYAEGGNTSAYYTFKIKNNIYDKNIIRYYDDHSNLINIGRILLINNTYVRIEQIISEDEIRIDKTISANKDDVITLILNVSYSDCDHSEGLNTTASGYYSHAEGHQTIASGSSSHAEGNNTIAYGRMSHTEGWGTAAGADCSHAEGYNTNAIGKYQHVFGKYNNADTNKVEIVGNGKIDEETGIITLSNARTLDWDGNEWLAGGITVEKESTFKNGLAVTGALTVTNSSTNTLNITADGEITAKKYIAFSDKRLKENIIDYKPQKSILDLPVYKYDYINGSKNNIGCLAQDLQEICPELVHEDSNGYLTIEESKLVYLLLDEVKKLKNQINKLGK